MRKYIYSIKILLITFCIFHIASISYAKESVTNLPQIEVEQVLTYIPNKSNQILFHHRWEIIVRLIDESQSDKIQLPCTVYTEYYNSKEGKTKLSKVHEIMLTRMEKASGLPGTFIGIYSNGKDFPHGTKVVVIYENSLTKKKVTASTMMYYH